MQRNNKKTFGNPESLFLLAWKLIPIWVIALGYRILDILIKIRRFPDTSITPWIVLPPSEYLRHKGATLAKDIPMLAHPCLKKNDTPTAQQCYGNINVQNTLPILFTDFASGSYPSVIHAIVRFTSNRILVNMPMPLRTLSCAFADVHSALAFRGLYQLPADT